MPSSDQTKDRRKSTLSWLQQFYQWQNHRNSILQRFEDTYSKYVVDPDAEPINILCLDGGGMKGYASIEVLRIIDEKYGGEDSDIFEHFDLIAGTSIGGAFAMVCNKMKRLQESCDEFRDGTDAVRERVFSNMKLMNLFKLGSAVTNEEDQMDAIFRERWADTDLLYPDGPPAMAVAALRYDSDCRENDGTNQSSSNYTEMEHEPLVLRTYEYPKLDEKTFKPLDAIVKSTSSLTGVEATAATAAVPGVVQRIKTTMNGEKISLADGGLFGNCPIEIAIDEARRLYPGRPLGVVLSIGMDKDKERSYIERATTIAKSVNSDLYFHRIVPHKITSKISAAETCLEKIANVEEQVRSYMCDNDEVLSELDKTMKKLFSQDRKRRKYVIEEGSKAHIRRSTMLSDKHYLKRSKIRAKSTAKSVVGTRGLFHVFSTEQNTGGYKKDSLYAIYYPFIILLFTASAMKLSEALFHE